MKRFIKTFILLLLAAAVVGGLIFAFLEGRKERTAEAEREAPVAAPSRVTAEQGNAVLTFDEAAQRANGLKLQPLARVVRSAEAQGTGVVLQVQSLVDLRTGYNNAETQLAKAQASLASTRAEYERLSKLNQNGKTASDKELEAARAAWQGDEATVRGAQDTLGLAKAAVIQRWGTGISDWLLADSPEFERLLAHEDLLIQVTPPPGGPVAAPPEVLIQPPGGKMVSARFIAPLPQVDPRLQQPAWLYLVGAQPDLIQGMNVTALLPSGAPRAGVLVPTAAVVWWQGRAWSYVEQTPGKFTRREVPVSNALPEGWFVTEGYKSGEKVAVSGAQMLLSEEFRSQIQVGEDEGKK